MTASPNRGFTLVEVLVALVIIALCASVFMGQMTRSARQYQVLEDKTLATWLAQNVLAEYQIGLARSGVIPGSQTLKMGGRQWQVDTVLSTENELQKIEVQVSGEGTENTIVRLQAYLPKEDS